MFISHYNGRGIKLVRR